MLAYHEASETLFPGTKPVARRGGGPAAADAAERSVEMGQPRFLDDLSFKALRLGDFAEFNRLVAGAKRVDFSDSDLRGVDFRGIADVNQVVVRGAYLRDADLRGLDLRQWDMEGCSLYHAKISGAYLPANLSPQEIANSVQLGTRMRSDV